MKEEIRLLAYYNWINRGRPWGDPLTDWNAAYESIIHGNDSLLSPIPEEHMTKVVCIRQNPEVILPAEWEERREKNRELAGRIPTSDLVALLKKVRRDRKAKGQK